MRTRVLLLAAFACLLSAMPAYADGDWDAFMKYAERFYLLDRQPFDSITCNISSTAINLDALRKQLKPIEDNIRITDNLNAFRVTYAKGKGVSFALPTLKIEVVSDNGVRDMQRLKEGIGMVEQGVSRQVQGIRQLLEGLLDDFESPKKDRIRLLEFSDGGGEVAYKYIYQGKLISDRFARNVLYETVTGEDGSMEGKAEYIPVEDRLAIKFIEAAVTSGDSVANTHTEVKYQTVDGILFPERIINEFRIVQSGMKMEGQFDVLVTDCRLK